MSDAKEEKKLTHLEEASSTLTIADVVQQCKKAIAMNSKLKELKELGDYIQQVYKVKQKTGDLQDYLDEYCKKYETIKSEIKKMKEV